MPRIRVLPDELVNQIAAGEVIERPASVVKELVENALDAEATRVDVSISQGGAQWISVTDDGLGMAPADAALAFRRHATSKLASAGDLARVASLGFRGEALPSIAAVARVRMRTRARGEATGVELEGEGTGISGPREIACAEGTRIEVAELFGRTPARRKFLKSPLTESRHVVAWLERIALARPDLHFTLERDGRPSLALFPTREPRERVIAVVPPGIGERLVPVSGERGRARIKGFASATDVTRGSASDVHLYVNARPVRDRLLLHAVREAYRDALPPGRHPVVVLYLDVDPEEVDVNVHPAKWEVRFRDFGEIRALVRGALVEALRFRTAPRPGPSTPREPAASTRVGEPRPPADFGLLAVEASGDAAAPLAPSQESRPDLRFASLRFVGQLLGTYLVCEGAGTMVLIDLHAAHERTLFERMRSALLADKLERQALLIPIRVELPRSSADALEAASASLDRGGFEIEMGETTPRGGVAVTLRSVPSLLASRRAPSPTGGGRRVGRHGAPPLSWRAMLEETAQALGDPEPSESREGIEAALHHALATAACHAAVRKGDRLDPREVQALLAALDEMVWFPNCPHGRPIACALDEAEIERRFLRR
jgi:DNA mismatch repair protein MutL